VNVLRCNKLDLDLTSQGTRGFRASGTEPLIRCYIEAKSKANLKKLDAACRQLLVA
jgi:phosphomannomutase